MLVAFRRGGSGGHCRRRRSSIRRRTHVAPVAHAAGAITSQTRKLVKRGRGFSLAPK